MKSVFLFFLVLIPTLFFPGSGFAQINYEDVVYLKNGSIIHGIIIEQIPNESIKIQTKDKNLFVYKMDEVLKITKEEAPPQDHKAETNLADKRETTKNLERKKKGFTNITEMSFARSFNKTYSYPEWDGSYSESSFDEINNGPSVGIQTINGYQFSPYFSLGAGVGMQAFRNLLLFPFFADFRATFMNKRVSPFAAFEIGGSFTPDQIGGNSSVYTNHEGGLMSLLAVGVKFFPIPKMALNFSLGYRYQELKVQSDGPDSYGHTYYDDKSLKQLNLRIGFTF